MDVLRVQCVTPADVRAAMRSQGIRQIDEVEAVILEADGSLSVLRTTDKIARTAIEDLAGYPPVPQAKSSGMTERME